MRHRGLLPTFTGCHAGDMMTANLCTGRVTFPSEILPHGAQTKHEHQLILLIQDTCRNNNMGIQHEGETEGSAISHNISIVLPIVPPEHTCDTHTY